MVKVRAAVAMAVAVLGGATLVAAGGLGAWAQDAGAADSVVASIDEQGVLTASGEGCTGGLTVTVQYTGLAYFLDGHTGAVTESPVVTPDASGAWTLTDDTYDLDSATVEARCGEEDVDGNPIAPGFDYDVAEATVTEDPTTTSGSATTITLPDETRPAPPAEAIPPTVGGAAPVPGSPTFTG